jgi:hypothetical protein
MHKARLIYFAVFACLIGIALVSALELLPTGMFDGAD